MQLRPRISDVKQPRSISELSPPIGAEQPATPPELLDYAGRVLGYDSLEQGRCSLIVRLNTERGYFVVKVSQGEYRGQELFREHQVMQDLQGLDIPVPQSIAFIRKGERAWQLREYRDGMTLRAILRTCIHSKERMPLISQMAATLATIHQIGYAEWAWDAWRDAALRTAEANMQFGLLDLEGEFIVFRSRGGVGLVA